jgi:EAL and modified HD-GYP domain-containing signal transduction protein
LEDIVPDDDVVLACQRLRRDGYVIALDDFVLRPGYERLVSTADIIKIDFQATKGDERAALAKRFASPRLRLLAEKIETVSEYDEARGLGYALFQGYFFAKPQMLSGRDIPASKLNCLRLLKVAGGEDFDLAKIEGIIKQDLAISMKLIRYLNSAAFRRGVKVDSIRGALTRLGEEQFRKWASLLAVSGLGGPNTPSEVILVSLLRARFCECAGARLGLASLSSFLIGLLSLVDVILCRPLIDVLGELALAPEIAEALLQKEGRHASLLSLAAAFERGDWEGVEQGALATGCSPDEVGEMYREAVRWAHDVMAGAVA